MSEPAHAPVRKAALIFILITVTLDILALGMIIPVLPHLFEQFLGNDTAMAARYYGYAGMLWAGMQFLWSPVLGTLSDRFGRRPVVLLSNLGLGLDYIFMALAPTLSWLFVGRAISGITAASITTAGAYIADVTPADKRAAAFGMIGAAFGIGFVIGPALGGLLGGIDPRLPFWVAAGMSLANFCYGWFVLPESLPPEKRTPRFVWKTANPLGALLWLKNHDKLLPLASVHFLSSLAHYVLPSTFVLYTSYRYGWNERTVGLALGAIGVCSGAVQGGLVRHVVARFGERSTLLAGLTFSCLSYLAMGLAPSSLAFWLTIPLSALAGLTGPSTQGLMSRRVSRSEQGQLQGANTSVRGIAGLIGPAMFTMTFAAFLHKGDMSFDLPGAAFVLAAILVFFAIPLARWATRPAGVVAQAPAETL